MLGRPRVFYLYKSREGVACSSNRMKTPVEYHQVSDVELLVLGDHGWLTLVHRARDAFAWKAHLSVIEMTRVW